MSRYNLVGPFYSKIASFVYGRQFYQIQAAALEQMNAKKVLVVGGGDMRLFKYCKENKAIYYLIDNSKPFTEMATKNAKEYRQKLVVLEGDFFSYNLQPNYDLVVFPFFLDQFGRDKIIQAIERILQEVKPKLGIIILDFSWKESVMAKIHLGILYFLFQRFMKIQARSLQIESAIKDLPVTRQTLITKSFFEIKCYKISAISTKPD